MNEEFKNYLSDRIALKVVDISGINYKKARELSDKYILLEYNQDKSDQYNTETIVNICLNEIFNKF